MKQRGFTLVELMIALALSSIVAAGVLFLTRAQLRAYDLNDGIVRAQQNARVGLEYIETQLRRACAGVAHGSVGVNVPGVTPSVQSCVQWWDNAAASGSTFTSSGTRSDALTIIYATMNNNNTYATTTAAVAGGTSPTVTVNDTTGFTIGDYVLITDFNVGNGNLYKIVSITAGTNPLGFGTIGTPVNGASFTPGSGNAVLKAQSLSFYYVAGSGVTPGQLYLDPDGVGNTNHANAQPLIDAVSDFQVSFGIDWQTVAPANGTQNDGLITEAATPGLNNDEWIGNYAGEVLPALPWNPAVAAAPMLLQIRATIVVRTTGAYTEQTSNVGPYEDGPTITAQDSAGRYPRFRTMRTVIAPRAWNRGE
jgi:prepilin-type N-terminal cleavage/methylation domain-containing protein